MPVAIISVIGQRAMFRQGDKVIILWHSFIARRRDVEDICVLFVEFLLFVPHIWTAYRLDHSALKQFAYCNCVFPR
jgi:hypothetical protein